MALQFIWHDMQSGDWSLMEAFLVLFCVTRSKDAYGVDNFEFSNESHQWNVFHQCRTRLVGGSRHFSYDHLYSYKLGRVEKTRINGPLPSTRSLKQDLSQALHPHAKPIKSYLLIEKHIPFSWKSIWQTKDPERATFFIWMTFYGRFSLLTIQGRDICWWLIGIACVKQWRIC